MDGIIDFYEKSAPIMYSIGFKAPDMYSGFNALYNTRTNS